MRMILLNRISAHLPHHHLEKIDAGHANLSPKPPYFPFHFSVTQGLSFYLSSLSPRVNHTHYTDR